MKYFVYSLKINEDRVYIGSTNNIKRRLSEHNRLFKRGDDKYLYNEIRKLYGNDIIFEIDILKEFESKLDGARYEAFLILYKYFNGMKLYQSVPVAFKYFDNIKYKKRKK